MWHLTSNFIPCFTIFRLICSKEYGNELPVLITDLADSTTFTLSHSELLEKCKNIEQELCVSKEQSTTGEKEAREQQMV